MALSEDTEDSIERKHRELCLELNMDTSAETASWKSYESIRRNYTLDGNPSHWLCCSLYVACRNTMTPTVGRRDALVEGNCVSLTRLLRLCKINLIEFFKKIKKWVEMTSMPEEFRTRIERLERNFSVSAVLFEKFQPIYLELFVNPKDDNSSSRSQKTRKPKNAPCSSGRLFELCWTLFVCAKGEFPERSDDLVSSYHMLLSCIDLLHANAVMGNRRDILNNHFSGLPDSWSSANYKPPESVPCIMTTLCRNHDGNYIDAMTTKEYTWKKVIKRFFEKNILKGDQSNLTGILDIANFDYNLKSLRNLYETYVLSVGEFDERIFFVGDHGSGSSVGSTNEEGSDNMTQLRQFSAALTPQTPLSNRKYLSGRNREGKLTPVSRATQSVARLQDLFVANKDGPSNGLKEMFKLCMEDPLPKLEKRISDYGTLFCSRYHNKPGNTDDYVAKRRLQLATALYWRVLENILKDEQRKKPTIDISSLLNQDIFHNTLFVCCLEIVISTYNSSQHKFPWILECFNLDAFNFYKIIEIIVLSEDKLTRDIVKHLNCIEEQVLESMAWASSSPLWNKISTSVIPIPQCQDVCLPENNGEIIAPVPNRRISDMFNSPNSGMELAKKQLFQDKPSVKPGESLLQNSKTVKNEESTPSTSVGTPRKLTKAGSLGLFIRKFYNLAVVRMQELCAQLKLTDLELQRKIWTCFEHAIVEHTDLMKDRHLDQILMCSIYVICKVTGFERTFTEIMRFYRNQPQAASHVYRSVLVKRKSNSNNNASQEINPGVNFLKLDTQSSGTTPGDLAGTSVVHGSEERGDLIKFYNTVYVVKVQTFAMLFSTQRNNQSEVKLSPLPVGRSQGMSPRRHQVSDKHALYVRALDHRGFPQSPLPLLTYSFSRSPAKDLRAINAMLSSDNKRQLIEDKNDLSDDSCGPPSAKVQVLSATGANASKMSKKLQGLIVDRTFNY